MNHSVTLSARGLPNYVSVALSLKRSKKELTFIQNLLALKLTFKKTFIQNLFSTEVLKVHFDLQLSLKF